MQLDHRAYAILDSDAIICRHVCTGNFGGVSLHPLQAALNTLQGGSRYGCHRHNAPTIVQ